MTNPAIEQQGFDRSIVRGEHGLVHSILLSPWYLPTVIAFAFAVRLCWMLYFHPKPVSDFAFYFRGAESIVKGHGYTHFGRFITAYFPIGYPLFLALLFWISGVSIIVALTANLVLSVVSLVLAYWIAREVFKSEVAGRFSLLLLAAYPNNIAYTSLVGVEIVHLFLLFLGTALLLPSISIKGAAHPWRLLMAGLVFGLATLVKMQTLLLPAFLLLLFPQFSWERSGLIERVKKVGILYAVLIAVISPWVIRNYILYNDIVLSNNDGVNLYVGNGPEANGTWVAVSWFGIEKNTLDEYKINQRARSEAINYIRAHPLQTLKLMPAKLASLFSHGDGVYWNNLGTDMKLKSARRTLRGVDKLNTNYEFLLIVFFIASLVFGCWKRLRNGKGNGWPLMGIAVIVYFVSIYLVYYGSPRYHFPIIPWMIMYSSALLSSLYIGYVAAPQKVHLLL
jgi:4-amino-4-deoxy-L-arabinose transferase-like glycosyltransferase